jgi:hypothetical protein
MWLCVGLHLGVGTMGFPLLCLVALVDAPVATLFMMPFLTLLRVPAGLENMAGAVIVLSAVTNAIMVWKKKLNGWVALAGFALTLQGLHVATSDANFTAGIAILTVIGVLGPMVWLSVRFREGRVLLLALFLMAAGYSTPPTRDRGAAPGRQRGCAGDVGQDARPARAQAGKQMQPLERRPARQPDKEFFRAQRGSGCCSDPTTTSGCRPRARRTPATAVPSRGSGTSSTTCGCASRRARSCRWP